MPAGPKSSRPASESEASRHASRVPTRNSLAKARWPDTVEPSGRRQEPSIQPDGVGTRVLPGSGERGLHDDVGVGAGVQRAEQLDDDRRAAVDDDAGVGLLTGEHLRAAPSTGTGTAAGLAGPGAEAPSAAIDPAADSVWISCSHRRTNAGSWVPSYTCQPSSRRPGGPAERLAGPPAATSSARNTRGTW